MIDSRRLLIPCLQRLPQAFRDKARFSGACLARDGYASRQQIPLVV
jgi:hypothetical protein